MVSEGDEIEWHDPRQKTHFEGEILGIEDIEGGVKLVFDVEQRYDGDNVTMEIIETDSTDDSRLTKL